MPDEGKEKEMQVVIESELLGSVTNFLSSGEACSMSHSGWLVRWSGGKKNNNNREAEAGQKDWKNGSNKRQVKII